MEHLIMKYVLVNITLKCLYMITYHLEFDFGLPYLMSAKILNYLLVFYQISFPFLIFRCHNQIKDFEIIQNNEYFQTKELKIVSLGLETDFHIFGLLMKFQSILKKCRPKYLLSEFQLLENIRLLKFFNYQFCF